MPDSFTERENFILGNSVNIEWFLKAIDKNNPLHPEEGAAHTESYELDGQNILVPRVRIKDGKAVLNADNALDEALEKGDYIVVPEGEDPDQYSKDLSKLIGKFRGFNKGGDVAAQMDLMLPSADEDTRSTKEFLQHPLETVPYFQRPMGSSTDDPQVGQDDAGNPVFKGRFGEYTVRVNPDQRTLRTKVEEAIPVVKEAVGEYLEDPKLPTKDQLSEFAKQAGQSAVESVKDLGDLMFKGKGTLGDVFAVAAGAGAASVPFDVPKGALRIFGGVNAEGAYEDKNLKKAVRLLREADVDPTNVQESYFKNKEIWEQTGWYVDPKDGQWRFEIDDSKSKLKDFKDVFNTELEPTSPAINSEKSKNFFNELGNVELSKEDGKYKKLSQVFDHENFYKNYPDLKDIDVIFYSNPKQRTLLGSASDDKIFINLSAYDNYEDIKSTLLHELQHVVQHEEGFVPGSSQTAVPGELLETKTKELEEKKRPLVIKEAVLKKELESPVEGEEKLNLIKKLIKVSNEIYAIDEENFKSEYEFYKGAGGEIESRLVQRRADLSGDERGPQNIAGGFPLDDRVDMLKEEGGKFQYTGSAGVDPYAYRMSPRVEPDPEKPGFLSGVKKKLGLTSDSAIDKPKDFNKGGAVMNEQMEMAFMQEGGLKDDGMRQDPVSGNEVPSGSMASEVRDDISAQLSEGEYVVPADVVRFFGVKFFEDLRMEAKMGLQSMEANGRIGGEPVAMETGELSDEEFARLLQQELGGNIVMAEGGMVPEADQDMGTPAPIKAADGKYIPGQMPTFNPRAFGLGFSMTPGYTPPPVAGTEPTVETEASCAARGLVLGPDGMCIVPPTPQARDDDGAATPPPTTGESESLGGAWYEGDEEKLLDDPETYIKDQLARGQMLDSGLAKAGALALPGGLGLILGGANTFNDTEGIARARAALMIAEARGSLSEDKIKELRELISKDAQGNFIVDQDGKGLGFGTGINYANSFAKSLGFDSLEDAFSKDTVRFGSDTKYSDQVKGKSNFELAERKIEQRKRLRNIAGLEDAQKIIDSQGDDGPSAAQIAAARAKGDKIDKEQRKKIISSGNTYSSKPKEAIKQMKDRGTFNVGGRATGGLVSRPKKKRKK